jgi:hypothetical protein
MITISGLARSMLLVSALALSFDIASGTLGHEEALANNAGGNGKGQGQGAANAGSKGGGAGGGSVNSANATVKNDPLHSSNTRRLNAFLNAPASALQHASANSAIGLIAKQYASALTGALQTQATLTTDPNAQVDPNAPTLTDAAAILARVANNIEVTPELVNQIHTKLSEAGLLDPALVAPPEAATTTTTDAAAPVQPSLAEQIAVLANTAQTEEPSQGLGPIY